MYRFQINGDVDTIIIHPDGSVEHVRIPRGLQSLYTAMECNMVGDAVLALFLIIPRTRLISNIVPICNNMNY